MYNDCNQRSGIAGCTREEFDRGMTDGETDFLSGRRRRVVPERGVVVGSWADGYLDGWDAASKAVSVVHES